MLREFFCHPNSRTRVWACIGLVAIVVHACLRAAVKLMLNRWMERFYDIGGAASEVGSGDEEALREGSSQITQLLIEFCLLCIPSVIIHPIFNLLINRWVLAWRLALITSYISRWNVSEVHIENAAQRIHEDTQRFARGLEGCFVIVLDSILTLAAFSPVILTLGAEVQPTQLVESWMLLLCIALSLVGMCVSIILGWPLVNLEVQNQRVEADIRKDLVMHEEVHVLATHESETVQADPNVTRSLKAFEPLIRALDVNYKKLYNALAAFSLWLGSFEQFVTVISPFKP